MPLARHSGPRPTDNLDRFFGWWPTFWRPNDLEDVLRVDEYHEDGTLVIRAEMAGIDPDKDVEITVTEGVIHISAERREEEKTEKKDYYRQELRYGAFRRDLPLPAGTSESDVQATYHDGILEIKVPAPKEERKETARRIPVAKS